jgi:pimeloyl-ACP methyl ester carboxylesterase
VPHTQLSIFKHAGHFPHRDEPAKFVRALDAFLTRHQRAAA